MMGMNTDGYTSAAVSSEPGRPLMAQLRDSTRIAFSTIHAHVDAQVQVLSSFEGSLLKLIEEASTERLDLESENRALRAELEAARERMVKDASDKTLAQAMGPLPTMSKTDEDGASLVSSFEQRMDLLAKNLRGEVENSDAGSKDASVTSSQDALKTFEQEAASLCGAVSALEQQGQAKDKAIALLRQAVDTLQSDNQKLHSQAAELDSSRHKFDSQAAKLDPSRRDADVMAQAATQEHGVQTEIFQAPPVNSSAEPVLRTQTITATAEPLEPLSPEPRFEADEKLTAAEQLLFKGAAEEYDVCVGGQEATTGAATDTSLGGQDGPALDGQGCSSLDSTDGPIGADSEMMPTVRFPSIAACLSCSTPFLPGTNFCTKCGIERPKRLSFPNQFAQQDTLQAPIPENVTDGNDAGNLGKDAKSAIQVDIKKRLVALKSQANVTFSEVQAKLPPPPRGGYEDLLTDRNIPKAGDKTQDTAKPSTSTDVAQAGAFGKKSKGNPMAKKMPVTFVLENEGAGETSDDVSPPQKPPESGDVPAIPNVEPLQQPLVSTDGPTNPLLRTDARVGASMITDQSEITRIGKSILDPPARDDGSSVSKGAASTNASVDSSRHRGPIAPSPAVAPPQKPPRSDVVTLQKPSESNDTRTSPLLSMEPRTGASTIVQPSETSRIEQSILNPATHDNGGVVAKAASSKKAPADIPGQREQFASTGAKLRCSPPVKEKTFTFDPDDPGRISSLLGSMHSTDTLAGKSNPDEDDSTRVATTRMLSIMQRDSDQYAPTRMLSLMQGAPSPNVQAEASTPPFVSENAIAKSGLSQGTQKEAKAGAATGNSGISELLM